MDYYNSHALNNQALMIALVNGHLNVVKYLIEHGVYSDFALIDVVDSRKQASDVMKYLIENGAAIHAYDDLALITAAKRPYLNTIKYLIQQAADTARQAKNQLALIFTLKYKRSKVEEYIIATGGGAGVGAGGGADNYTYDKLDIFESEYKRFHALMLILNLTTSI